MMPKQYVVRLISSLDHGCTKQELIQKISEYGTDRYDPNIVQIFDDFYRPYQVDIFGTLVSAADLEEEIIKLRRSFPDQSLADRKRLVHPDIAIVYDADKCVMINKVYDNIEASDCFRFVTTPQYALLEVRSI